MNHPGLNGIKHAKVRFEHDPNNPLAPPRRVIEKMGFWERMTGPKDSQGSQYHTPTQHHIPLMPMPGMSPYSQSRPLPTTFAPPPSAPMSAGTALRPTPFPTDFKYLPRSERHAWEKQRKEEMKFFKSLGKEHEAAMKAEKARVERECKMAQHREKEEMKARKSAMKLEKKLGYRPMPQYIPPNHHPIPPMSSMPAPSVPGPGQPTSWMILPTLEQFGVRRPFDAPGKPQAVDIGGTEWPMMSRTMTHALKDMGREERVHLDQAGHTWSPGWYRD